MIETFLATDKGEILRYSRNKYFGGESLDRVGFSDELPRC